MSFAERASERPARKIASCAIRTILDGLPPDEADALRGMLADDIKIRPHTSLVADFADEGYDLSDATVGKHRRHECSCRHLVSA